MLDNSTTLLKLFVKMWKNRDSSSDCVEYNRYNILIIFSSIDNKIDINISDFREVGHQINNNIWSYRNLFYDRRLFE